MPSLPRRSRAVAVILARWRWGGALGLGDADTTTVQFLVILQNKSKREKINFGRHLSFVLWHDCHKTVERFEQQFRSFESQSPSMQGKECVLLRHVTKRAWPYVSGSLLSTLIHNTSRTKCVYVFFCATAHEATRGLCLPDVGSQSATHRVNEAFTSRAASEGMTTNIRFTMVRRHRRIWQNSTWKVATEPRCTRCGHGELYSGEAQVDWHMTGCRRETQLLRVAAQENSNRRCKEKHPQQHEGDLWVRVPNNLARVRWARWTAESAAFTLSQFGVIETFASSPN